MTTKARVLIVDDEPQIHRFLRPVLEASGYVVDRAETGAAALKAAANGAPDVILLDLGLPDMDGKDVVRDLRVWSQVPVIILSARDQEAEKIAALDLGADDYVNKPFGVGELLARVRAAIRHAATDNGENPVVTVGDLVVDTLKRVVTRGGERLRLTPKEYDLLHVLARNAGKVVTHRQLLATVWGSAHADDAQYLRVFISQLRQKIDGREAVSSVIETEPGVGYRLREDLT